MHPRDFADQARSIIASLTPEEKISLLSGSTFWKLQPIERVGLETIMVSDGPHGLRAQDAEGTDAPGMTNSQPATCFPTAVTMASSWDLGLIEEVAAAIGVEAKALGVSVVLGPGVNIKRSPLCGRNFEYFSEDPFLSARMGVAFIEGVQSQNVGTSIKHFAANNQEDSRMVIDTLVDERTLREIYLPSFEMAVTQAAPWTVMHAYNRLNGVYCGEHHWLLEQVLRREWGFEGLVVTDWGGTSDRVEAVAAGTDLEMPSTGGLHDPKITAALDSGALSTATLDQRAQTVIELTLAGRAARVGEDGQEAAYSFDIDAHHALAERAAAQGAVLLKNRDDLLPLKPGGTVAVIGGFAEQPRFQGAGSSQVRATRIDTPLDRLRATIEGQGGQVTHAVGFDPDYAHEDPAMIDEAVALAKDADVVLVLAGLPALFESEGFDRTTLDMPPQINALITAVAAANPATAVVLSNGGAVLMPWLEQVGAVLEIFLAGQAGAGALAGLLSGAYCPSGKLAETFPMALDPVPAHVDFGAHGRRVVYREGLNVGYRFFTSYDEPVLFPFGFGLSYTRFAYGEATLEAPQADLSEPVLVRVPVTNTGAVAGAEIVQVYVRQRGASVYRPDRELKGFAKLTLQPGETQTAEITLDRRAFAFWDQDGQIWRVEATPFEILVGSSCEAIHSTLAFEPAGDPGHNMREAFSGKQPVTMSDTDLAALGLTVTPPESTRPFHRNSTMGEIRDHWLGRRIYAQTDKQMQAFFAGDDNPVVAEMGRAFLNHLPLRALQALSGGKVSDGQMTMIIALLNGHWLAALRGLLGR